MPLTSKMPSGAPNDYYKLVLKGIAAEPGASAAVYHALMNKDSQKRGRRIGCLALDDPVPVPEPIRDIIVPGAEVDASPERPKRPAPSGRRGTRAKAARSSGSRDGAALAPPDPPPPEPPIEDPPVVPGCGGDAPEPSG